MSSDIDKLIKICYVTIIILTFGFLLYYNYGSIILFLTNIKSTEAYVKSWGKLAPAAFIAIQVVQVVIFFIPGEFVQVSAGYLFGMFSGTVLSLIGIAIGSAVTFGAVRVIGAYKLSGWLNKKEYRLLKLLIKKSNNKTIILLLYLIPGFPKDILGYLLGVTEIKFSTYMVINIVGRLPGIFITSLIGSKFKLENYNEAIYLILLSALVVFIGYKERNNMYIKINKWTNKR